MTAGANRRTQHVRHSARSPESTEGEPPLANLTHASEDAAFEQWERLWRAVLRKHAGKIAEAQSAYGFRLER